MNMFIIKNTANNIMYILLELHTFFINIQWNCIQWNYLQSISFPSMFSLHSSSNLSNILFIFYYKNSPMSHDLSHSHSQVLGFQINPLSHIPLSINSLHSHLHLSSFHL